MVFVQEVWWWWPFFAVLQDKFFFLWHGFHHGAGLGTSILATLGYATSRNGGGGGFTAMRRARAAVVDPSAYGRHNT